MNICIPIEVNNGLQSQVCAHFGSAPAFMVVDANSENCRVVQNNNQHHAHGMCNPLQSIINENIDAIVVGGIGMGALTKLKAANIQVYVSEYATVAESLAAFKSGKLKIMQTNMACAHHGHDH